MSVPARRDFGSLVTAADGGDPVQSAVAAAERDGPRGAREAIGAGGPGS